MKFTILIALFTLSAALQAQEFEADIGVFFDLYKKGEIEQAVDTLYKSNPYVSSVSDQIKNVKTQLGSLTGLMGELHSIEKIDTFMVGKSMVHITYIGIYDRQPVRFEFQFFKLESDWRIFSFAFDADVFDDIETLAQPQALSRE